MYFFLWGTLQDKVDVMKLRNFNYLLEYTEEALYGLDEDTDLLV
jgi:hypothetical protein